MMPLALFGFLGMTLIDILDILLVALIIYLLFRWIRGSSAVSIFIAIISLYVIWVVVSALNMKMMTALMETVLGVGVLALIVIFQPEIRRFLVSLGNRYRGASKGSKFLSKLFDPRSAKLSGDSVREITEACRLMSDARTGALIVFPHFNSLEDIIQTGDRIDGMVSRRLVMNLFFKNSPLHDGAMIIDRDRIVAARCTLPMSQKTDLPAHYGMRHKAAIGLTEECDADVIVVSEETGAISFVRGGNVTPIGNINELKLLLDEAFGAAQKEENAEKKED